MAYEYNPRSEPFNRVSNPHRVENMFLAACTTACLVAAFALLIDARAVYPTHDFVRFLREIVSAVGLLALALTYGLQAMSQLRFFFGRGQPADLVPSLRADEYGYRAADGTQRQIPDAAALRATLQQNAIQYRVPPGPIDNLLYYLVHDLVTSPRLTQTCVREQFRNLVAIAFVLILFCVSLIGVHNAAALGWIGCFSFVLTNVLVLRPLTKSGRRIDSSLFSERAILGLVVIAVVGPVIAASLIPANSFLLRTVIDFIPPTFVALGSALAVSVLVFFAGTANTVKPREFAIAPHLETPSVNAPPSQLYTELARELQRLWADGIPNRTYMRIVPDVSGRQGTFRADVIEERQPMPLDIEKMTFDRALALSTTRFLVVADALCTLMTFAGATLTALGAQRVGAYTELTVGAALLIVAQFGIRSANAFWRRFDFSSVIYWIDWNGTYTRAATKIGALMNDRVQSERDVISVESMTLRVWVAELDSVAFSTDEERNIVAIRGLPDEAARLGQLLAAFLENQSAITAPMSAVDRDRIDAMNALNEQAAGTSPSGAIALHGSRPDAIAGGGAPFCAACGTRAVAPGAAFCGACGARLG